MSGIAPAFKPPLSSRLTRVFARFSDAKWPFLLAGAIVCTLVGLAGIYPHLLWSVQNGEVSWFFNSYDEGYYGWSSVSNPSLNRIMSGFVMSVLHFLSGGQTQLTMILADFILPLLVTVTALYVMRPLFSSVSLALAGALLMVFSAESIALRSTLTPHASLRVWLETIVVPLCGGESGWLQIGNPTSTFWIFRTPEPQISLILTFIAVGLALRAAISASSRHSTPWFFWLVCLAVGAGYLFCALPLAAAFMLFALAAWRPFPQVAGIIGLGGVLVLLTCTALSLGAAGQSGGAAFIFSSRTPVITISGAIGALTAVLSLVKLGGLLNDRQKKLRLFAVSFGATPIILANQQLLTGKMVYLLNFDNFGFAPLVAASIVFLAASWSPSPATSVESGRLGRFASRYGAWAFVVLVLWTVATSQKSSYEQYLDTNSLAKSYAKALKQLPLQGASVACEDFYTTEILSILMGYRPPLLVARDVTYDRPISRLSSPDGFPDQSQGPRAALFAYLYATGCSSSDLHDRLEAVVDPAYPNWKDRFMLGSFLYNYADFWSPITHARDSRNSWIEAQRDAVVDDYARYLETSVSKQPKTVLLVHTAEMQNSLSGKSDVIKLALPDKQGPHQITAFLFGNPTRFVPAKTSTD